MKYNSIIISPKMQLLCLALLEFIEDHKQVKAQDIHSAFTSFPVPLINLGLNLIYNHDLIYIDYNTREISANPMYPYATWIKTLQNTRCHPTDGVCYEFKKEASITPYKFPPLNDITYKELNHLDYFKFKEFYDYETHTLKPDTGFEFFGRQFGAMLVDETGDKRTHIYTATAKNGSILGFIAITNFTNDIDLFTNLPHPNSEIFNVNYIATRKGAENLGIATNLLRYAINDVQSKENLKLLCYNPICDQSKCVMNKVFKNPNYEIIDRDYMTLNESGKYGVLSGYIIRPVENFSVDTDENISS